MKVAERQVTDAEVNFWRWARQAAMLTGNRHHSYNALKAQWQGIRPDADFVEHEAAMTRLAYLLKI